MWLKTDGGLLDFVVLLRPRRMKLRVWKEEFLNLANRGASLVGF